MKLTFETFFRRKRVIRPTRTTVLTVLTFATIFIIPYKFWLTKAAESLVLKDNLAKSDIILIENWDYPYFSTFVSASRLQAQGFAERIIIASNDRKEKDIATVYEKAIALYSSKAGIRPGTVEEIKLMPSEPVTLNRARQISEILKARAIRSVILVSGYYHSKRSTLAYRRFLEPTGTRILSYPADPEEMPDQWWKSPSGIKVVSMQFLKYVLYRLLFI
jgi:hypothetical protein